MGRGRNGRDSGGSLVGKWVAVVVMAVVIAVTVTIVVMVVGSRG